MNTANLPRRSLTNFYQDAFSLLDEARIPFLIGGAFAQSRYTGRDRDTKDLDIILRRADIRRALDVFADAGYRVELAFPHWLAKIHQGDYYLDIMFGSGNGVVQVDDRWFARGVEAEVLEQTVRLCPPEELLWSKAFVQERERFDGNEVLHLLHACAATMDWDRVLTCFGDHWAVLLAHLTLFQFAYPDRRADIPRRVIEELTTRLLSLRQQDDTHVCYGTLLSREHFLFDVSVLGYEDARRTPRGGMSSTDIEIWTEAIGRK
jgi:hypothetical protein